MCCDFWLLTHWEALTFLLPCWICTAVFIFMAKCKIKSVHPSHSHALFPTQPVCLTSTGELCRECGRPSRTVPVPSLHAARNPILAIKRVHGDIRRDLDLFMRAKGNSFSWDMMGKHKNWRTEPKNVCPS